MLDSRASGVSPRACRRGLGFGFGWRFCDPRLRLEEDPWRGQLLDRGGRNWTLTCRCCQLLWSPAALGPQLHSALATERAILWGLNTDTSKQGA